MVARDTKLIWTITISFSAGETRNLQSSIILNRHLLRRFSYTVQREGLTSLQNVVFYDGLDSSAKSFFWFKFMLTEWIFREC